MPFNLGLGMVGFSILMFGFARVMCLPVESSMEMDRWNSHEQ